MGFMYGLSLKQLGATTVSDPDSKLGTWAFALSPCSFGHNRGWYDRCRMVVDRTLSSQRTVDRSAPKSLEPSRNR